MRINPNALPSAPFEMIVLAKEVDVTNDTYGQLSRQFGCRIKCRRPTWSPRCPMAP
jgi:hypothetical protein